MPPQGDTLNGLFVPGGTRIAPCPWALTRKRAVFGDDAELFRPERWLEADDEKRQEMKRTTELVFGYGRWACAGRPIAFMELNKIFVEVRRPFSLRLLEVVLICDQLLRNFDFQLIYPTKPWTSVNQNLFMQKDMWVSVTDRR